MNSLLSNYQEIRNLIAKLEPLVSNQEKKYSNFFQEYWEPLVVKTNTNMDRSISEMLKKINLFLHLFLHLISHIILQQA